MTEEEFVDILIRYGKHHKFADGKLKKYYFKGFEYYPAYQKYKYSHRTLKMTYQFKAFSKLKTFDKIHKYRSTLMKEIFND